MHAPPRSRTILLTGATGYVGGQLLPALLDRGHTVRCLVRRPERASLPAPAEVHRGDVATGAGVLEALEGADVAYYLVHSMDGSGGDFAQRDRHAAATFARAARTAGVGRVVYLGGLAPAQGRDSEHLRSRDEVARVLAEQGPPLVHARAAMVVGAGSASFIILRGLVQRLPVMLTPRWVDTRSQPVAIRDVVAALVTAAEDDDPPAELQLGGAEVLTYREMMDRTAAALGRRGPAVLPVPVLSPRLSSYWVSLFTPVPAGLVRPLVDGLTAEMVVTDPPPPGYNDEPLGFDEAVREAVEWENAVA